MTSSPLPIALIGLSASTSGGTGWAANAHLPALLSPRGRALYKITALLNSSVAAAQAAIAHHGLDPRTKAYGAPADLAADPDVRAVICSVRVDRHLQTTLPAIQAGKHAYIEWPIAASPADAETLLAAARKSGARVAIGLQGRWAPPVAAVRRVLAAGALGRVVSAEFRACGGTVDRASVPEALAYFTDRAVGGNPMTIGFAHAIDALQAAVAEIEDGASARAHVQRPDWDIVAGPERRVVRSVANDVPDFLAVHGRLAASAHVARGAPVSATFRTGQPFPDEPALVWSVHCERGEVALVSRAGAALQASAYSPAPVVRVHEFASGQVREEAWAWSAEQAALPVPARCVLACLEAFAVGDEAGYTTLEQAVARAWQVQRWVFG